MLSKNIMVSLGTLYREKTCHMVTLVRFPRICRAAHTQSITKNIYYTSITIEKITVDPKSMKFNKQIDKPICIMLEWLLANPKQVMKYVDIYLQEGFDVLRVNCDPLQLVLPKRGAQLIARDLLNIMAANNNSYMIHGFSMGGYIWCEVMVRALTQRDRYQPVLDRVEAQIWDSLTDFRETSVGVPLALFRHNKLGQIITQLIISLYLKAFYNIATVHYERGCEVFYASPCRAPALFLLSSSDPVGSEKRIRIAYNLWVEMGIQCTWKCWAKSAHVRHYKSHPEEYLALVHAHIRSHVTALRTRTPNIQAQNK